MNMNEKLINTHFLSATDAAKLIASRGVAHCIEGIAQNIRADFARWPDFDKTPRVAAHSKDGVIELMPVADDKQYAFKYVNGHPYNHRFDLPTVMAFGAIAEVATGVPVFLSELTLITALRTAAMSALAAKILARPGAKVMALIGNGAQSEFQALGFQRVVGIDTLRVYDIDPAATAKLVRNLSGSGLNVVVCQSAKEATQGADIITTVTADKVNATILTPDMIAPGVHVNGVGGDCPGKTELHADVLRAGPVFVEYEPQSRIEGDVQQMPADFPVTELWRVITGQAEGRTHADQVTVFDSVGFALEDYSALRYMHAAALEMGVGQPIELIPTLSNPKDLFATVRDASAAKVGAEPLKASAWAQTV